MNLDVRSANESLLRLSTSVNVMLVSTDPVAEHMTKNVILAAT